MTRISGYFYFDGSTERPLETPSPIIDECDTCDGLGYCECCRRDCDDCDGDGESERDYISVETLKANYPDIYDLVVDDIQSINRQRELLNRRYGSYKIVKSLHGHVVGGK